MSLLLLVKFVCVQPLITYNAWEERWSADRIIISLSVELLADYDTPMLALRDILRTIMLR